MTDFAQPLPAATFQSPVSRIRRDSTSENAGSELQQAFSALLAAQGSGSDTGGADALVSMLLLKLVERIDGGAATTTAEHVNQFDAEISLGGDGRNTNCGPASLVMALNAVGLSIGSSSLTSGEAVVLARKKMVNDTSRDGVDATGRYLERENNNFTNLTEVRRGAQAASARTQVLAPTAAGIREALLGGASVVISGTFSGKILPWTGDRGADNATAPGGATAHIVAVTGYDRYTGMYKVQDPARRTPVMVSAETLESFMRGNAGALAIYNPRQLPAQGWRASY
ncbi:MAG TPA: C39 family peptidase [Anaerolineales bacterium]|nr:C39 family peptidase [Anaerolineales bacterium]